MFDFETSLSGIEYKIRQLIEQNDKLKGQVMQLKEQNEEQAEIIKQQEKNISQLKEETQILKIRNTLVDKGDSAEIKLKINQMIRNIDKSLSLLNDIS